MQQDIVSKAVEMFLTYGFKSVTMDEIASEMGVSKKTIYQHFENKNDLVEACTLYMFDVIANGIEQICASDKNPISELYEIKNFVLKNLKDEKATAFYQLKKYYPKIYAKLHEKEFEMVDTCIIENLRKGVSLGYYRPEINIEFVARIYYSGMHSIQEESIFSTEMFSFKQLEEYYLEYHLRAIATTEGIEILNKIIYQSNT